MLRISPNSNAEVEKTLEADQAITLDTTTLAAFRPSWVTGHS